jgi:NDP-sugar pyrophosphorylase family protein
VKLDGIFILAAGLGKRLRPLTLFRPKPCIPVLGQSPLMRWMSTIRNLKPTHVVLNTHHLPQEVQHEWESAALPPGWRYSFSHEPEILDTAGGLREALRRLGGGKTVLVLNGDVIADAPLEGLFQSHRESGALCTAWVNPSHPPQTVTWDKHHRVVSFEDHTGGKAVFCGIYLIEREILNFIPDTGPYPIIPALEAAKAEHKVQVYVHDTPDWCDMGSLERYWALHNDEAMRKRWIVRGRKQGEFPNGCLAAGKNCSIAKGALLKNVLLWDNVVIGSDTSLENVIVTDGVVVEGEHRNQILTPHGIHPLFG